MALQGRRVRAALWRPHRAGQAVRDHPAIFFGSAIAGGIALFGLVMGGPLGVFVLCGLLLAVAVWAMGWALGSQWRGEIERRRLTAVKQDLFDTQVSLGQALQERHRLQMLVGERSQAVKKMIVVSPR